jgi:glycosyltransferase involved in cell wall biosynthesis
MQVLISYYDKRSKVNLSMASAPATDTDQTSSLPAELPHVTLVARAIGANPDLRYGGTEVQVAALVEGYLAAGGEVTLICRESTVPDHPRLTVRRLRVPSRPFLLSSPWFILTASFAVARHGHGLIHATGALVASKVDVITVHFCHTAYADRRLPSRAGRRNVWYLIHAWGVLKMNTKMERWCYRPRKTRVLVGPSQGVVDEVAQHFSAAGRQARVIHNGIDLQRFSSVALSEREVCRREAKIPDEALAAVFVGGDWHRKGLGKAIRALALAPSWHLLVVGEGDQNEFQGLAERVGVAERVRFLGRRHDVERVYAAGDAFVFPSEYEVASLVTYEAAASGLPLLVSKINGTEELVVDGYNGWFVSSSNDIARYLALLEQDPSARIQMASSAKASAAPYTWPSMVTSYAQLYCELAGS